MTLVLDQAALNRMLKSDSGIVGRDIDRRATIAQAGAKAEVGVETGRLRTSIVKQPRRDAGGYFVRVGSDVRYALLHHQGTRPHVIVPRKAKVLRFPSKGRIVFAKIVHHPGTKANKFLTAQLRRIL